MWCHGAQHMSGPVQRVTGVRIPSRFPFQGLGATPRGSYALPCCGVVFRDKLGYPEVR